LIFTLRFVLVCTGAEKKSIVFTVRSVNVA
jgi:hypothetical protein